MTYKRLKSLFLFVACLMASVDFFTILHRAFLPRSAWIDALGVVTGLLFLFSVAALSGLEKAHREHEVEMCRETLERLKECRRRLDATK